MSNSDGRAASDYQAASGGPAASALERLVSELGDLVATGHRPDDPAQLGALLTLAVRLYSGGSENPYGPAELAELKLTPTEACTAAAALLHAQSLTPFEFAVWFSNSRVDATRRQEQDGQEQR
ncbi:hypothetical protein ETD83_25990 [Actinomadura soli]|uniref:Uncharacterized protein n=1 Tax=Actinomadura soli TaxID=2508997 RepID=A0A5C4J674_9ACTN|nr:hypothetical protein [Actinomadura soli]TMQ93104.1 hypothetical protein ETD83_25990 [Actinomadura soli]